MNKTYWAICIILLISILSCKKNSISKISDEEKWKMGWRLIESSMDDQLMEADSQFDSLLAVSNIINRKFLLTGLEVKSKLNKDEEVLRILSNQNVEMLKQLCTNRTLNSLEPCNDIPEQKIENEKLQLELIRMYVDDQACRGNIMDDIITKYKIPRDNITHDGGIIVDERNRTRLKEIFAEVGFPTKEHVGKDAMYGIFLMLQHSDGDKEWQKSQLPNIEKAVKNGDLNGQSYAYLYDRVKILSLIHI